MAGLKSVARLRCTKNLLALPLPVKPHCNLVYRDLSCLWLHDLGVVRVLHNRPVTEFVA